MKLESRQTGFKADEITYLDRKAIVLDRAMLKLFELLRFDGRRPARRRQIRVSEDELAQRIVANPQRFPGFAGHESTTAAWLKSDLLQVRRKSSGEEEIVGPWPLHLNAYKLTKPSAVADHGASEQVWALLHHADPKLLTQLKKFFSRGLDNTSDSYDGVTSLDLETLVVLGLADGIRVDATSTPIPAPLRPLCVGQGRLLAEDLRCLLAYEGRVPRQVLAGYMRTTIGLHLALFVLRLLRLVPAQVAAARRGDPARACPLEEREAAACVDCPFATEMVIDLTDDYASAPGVLARASARDVFSLIPIYVRAVFMVNRLKDYAAMYDRRRPTSTQRTFDELLDLARRPPDGMDGYFDGEILRAIGTEKDEEQDPIIEAMLAQPDLPALERFVELLCYKRLKNERGRIVDLIDSLTQKNKPGGFMRQTTGQGAPRWFAMDGHLLETLAQIAVVDRDGDELRTRAILLDDFIDLLRRRYGLVIYAPAHRDVPPEDLKAWRENERAFRRRLHEIGFYTDLSDAYNSQTLRPRYRVEHV